MLFVCLLICFIYSNQGVNSCSNIIKVVVGVQNLSIRKGQYQNPSNDTGDDGACLDKLCIFGVVSTLATQARAGGTLKRQSLSRRLVMMGPKCK